MPKGQSAGKIHPVEKSAISKIKLRIIPMVLILYVVSYLDRVNLGYASLDMNADLGISGAQYGLMAGIFFIGYFLFEIPSNMLMHKIGARVWIARILISWGIVAMITGFAQNVVHLYTIRFILGIAEAGFFPGILLYLTYWFPAKERARSVGMFMVALPISYIIGAPLSGFILDYVHWGGFDGWRWMFIIEGLPAVILGILTLFVLPNRPLHAKWLTNEEKTWLSNELEKENHQKLERHHFSTKEVLFNGRIWLLGFMYFCVVIALYGVGFWVPQIVKNISESLSDTGVGFVVAIPYIAGGIAMVWWSRHSDKTLERRYHTAIPLIVCAAGLTALIYISDSAVLSIVMLAIVIMATFSYFGPFWSLPSLFLTEASAAVGIATINSLGNLGGFLGPYAIGAVSDATGSIYSGLYIIVAFLIIGFLVTLGLRLKGGETEAVINKSGMGRNLK
ncbi:ACS family tartrate transporter-like MFS transporter [Scopulibacillus darangshiensis]|uniref:ACS family tartrate transporter-like MFS transporter n=1 Tax=Scopulibacillus darangshiensis TaxID=442528 RepID=A0A4R2P263_9BACL|nr:MFS transporter [Scopulibacillus darangshiensis]TCP28770.1 ACS family tartrate transporter-like MFS transporter [Scopulibacillus darangshiensis]